jgi:hypothetical protein
MLGLAMLAPTGILIQLFVFCILTHEENRQGTLTFSANLAKFEFSAFVLFEHRRCEFTNALNENETRLA